MKRRTLLGLLGAMTLAGGGANAGRRPRVVVVGAGIIGASIAWHLARAGAAVTVLDRQGPATHASRGTFAWLNATWAKQPRHYHRLNQRGLVNWKRVQQALDLPIRWNGSLEWFASAEQQATLTGQIAEQTAWGERARMLDASEVATLEPALDFPRDRRAAFSGNDGAVDPVLATTALLADATKHGAQVQYPCEVTDVTVEAGAVSSIHTTLGTLTADRLVLATGAAPHAAQRFADIDIPQRTTAGVIAITTPLPPIVNRIVAAPGVHMHQRDDGRVVLGEQDGPPDTHAQRLQARPNTFPTSAIAEQHARRILEAATRFVPALAKAEFDQVHIGWRPLPLDGHPVLGVSPTRRNVYVAITHSGVTLAPIIGELVARELLEDVALAELEPYRPTRVFERVKRY
jgi:glycine/D-amino acid oxidase-like deaminating enzyme